jgi:hypothetical protein
MTHRSFSRITPLLASTLLFSAAIPAAHSDSLSQNFATPPAAARPWVYWFWLNGNVTKTGITADLEAMKRVGIGGVLIMEVDQGTPPGPVAFGGPEWRTLFRFVCSEAQRLGLQVNMNNDAGWCGSGGPWITPALSMQKLVWTETTVQGPQHIEQTLPQPEAVAGYYADVAVLAMPTPADDSYRIPDLENKSGSSTAPFPQEELPPPAAIPAVPASQTTDLAKVVDMTSRCQDGKLIWDVPPGKWTLLRLGHTSTGTENHPAPVSGLGLESDKLSRAATKAQFDGLIAKLIADNRPLVGRSLVSTHIDSWETGSQDWTPTFREDFRRLRGYDPLPYLPVMTGRAVQNLDVSGRFLWDVRQTISELLLQNYATEMRTLAHQHGLRLSIEGYTAPTDDLAYGGVADEPMAEFWSSPMYSSADTVPLMSSAAHTYGKPILGAEAFTAGGDERWLLSPASVKSIGDWAFCEGVNRFVIHRYAMQPFANARPGVSMGPYGLHYERTQTWWEQSKPWHRYLARCQYLLRQGQFVADVCYLEPEGSPRHFIAPPATRSGDPKNRPGYNFDSCSPEVVLTRMSVKNGRLTLPDGMNYRLLVLPDAQTMTPKLLTRIATLVQSGATIVGAPPMRSPSLEGYPECDAQVRKIAAALWGNCDGKTVFSHSYGQGRVIWGRTPEQILTDGGVPPDFSSDSPHRFNYVHRHRADGADIYFVANSGKSARTLSCTFRTQGMAPEFWWPETGKTEPIAEYTQTHGTTRLPIRLEGTESVFVIFRPNTIRSDHAVRLTRNGADLLDRKLQSVPVIRRALYGVLSDPNRTRDVRAKLQALLDSSAVSQFQVAAMAAGDDPAYGIVKTLTVDYTVNGHLYHITGQDPDTIDLSDALQAAGRTARLRVTPDHHLLLEAWKNGRYRVQTASGKSQTLSVTDIPKPEEIKSRWSLSFPPQRGTPPHVTLDTLASWSQSQDAGIRDFSGTATYRTTFTVPSGILSRDKVLSLDLGDVQVIADVTLNGKPLGTLWKPPYRADVTQVVRSGTNTLVVHVTNLWVNRMIADEHLPEDSDRNSDGTLMAWPQWLLDGKPSPTGRTTFTTWRRWGKDDALQPSGLIGPVTLSFGQDLSLNSLTQKRPREKETALSGQGK